MMKVVNKYIQSLIYAYQCVNSGLPSVSKHFFLKVGGAHGVIVKALDCGIVVHKFKLQSLNYIHFQTNILGKGMNPLILPFKD